MNEDPARFGTRLRACRESAGLSQEDLALRSGLSMRTIGNLERGSTRWPYPRTLQRLADGLELRGQARAAFVSAAGRRHNRAASSAAADPDTSPGSEAIQTPRQLPGVVQHFVGRAAELDALTRLLGHLPAHDDSAAVTTVVISAIAGTAGVGKTALALRWAHQVAGLFPDGQLYANLRGYDPGDPVTPADALTGLLLAAGMNASRIPAGLDDRAAMYRGLLAGRRMLIVLDNALDTEQVRPLLPGSGECVVVVTSRDSLAGLVARDGAVRLELDALPAADAAELLRALIGPRVAEEPHAAAELVEQCCRLPLALRVAAELAAARPQTPLAGLVAELFVPAERLVLLAAGGDPASGVQRVFSWSLRYLDAEVAQAFTLLGLHPGPDVDAYELATLLCVPVTQARQILDTLAHAHLVDPRQTGRFGMHDLLRAYARCLAADLPKPVQEAVAIRLLARIPHPAVGRQAPGSRPAIKNQPGRRSSSTTKAL